jgi:hypothetical protein
VLSLIAAYSQSHAEPISADALWALHLALAQFFFQFSNNAAIGYWNGREQQRFANLRLAAFTLAKHALALMLLAIWNAGAATYMGAFSFIAALDFVL